MTPSRARLVLALAWTFGSLGSATAAPPRADWGLPSVKEAPRPWLGIGVTEVDAVEGASAPGLTLARVTPGSPAAVAGLEAGDILLALDGRVLDGAAELKEALAGKRPDDTVSLTVLHDGRARTVRVQLVPAPASEPERRVRALPIPAPAPAPTPPAPAPPGVPSTPPAVALTFLGPAERPSLGVETMDLEPGLAAYFGVPEGLGVLVESVVEGSSAARMGVRAGDVLLHLGGRPVASGTQLAQALRGRAPGERVALTLVRDKRRIELAAVLGRESVPEWRFDSPPEARVPARAPAAPGTPAAPEALAALAQHHAREIARLEVLLAAQEDGDEELAALLGRAGAASGGIAADAKALRERLEALRREQRALEQALATRP